MYLSSNKVIKQNVNCLHLKINSWSKKKLKNKNEVRDGTSLVEEELIKLKQAEQLRKVEDMLINKLYTSAVILRINILVAEKVAVENERQKMLDCLFSYPIMIKKSA